MEKQLTVRRGSSAQADYGNGREGQVSQARPTKPLRLIRAGEFFCHIATRQVIQAPGRDSDAGYD